MAVHRPTRPKPRKQPEHLAIRDPFKRAMLRRMDEIAEAIDRNTAAVAELRERICVFVQRPAVPVVRGNAAKHERKREASGEDVRPPWLDPLPDEEPAPDELEREEGEAAQ